jgi:hypothetical protein
MSKKTFLLKITYFLDGKFFFGKKKYILFYVFICLCCTTKCSKRLRKQEFPFHTQNDDLLLLFLLLLLHLHLLLLLPFPLLLR